MLSQVCQYSGKMSPLLLYGTNLAISGDICRKVDRTFVTEIFEIIKTALYKVIRHSRMGEIALRDCVLYCSEHRFCKAKTDGKKPKGVFTPVTPNRKEKFE